MNSCYNQAPCTPKIMASTPTSNPNAENAATVLKSSVLNVFSNSSQPR